MDLICKFLFLPETTDDILAKYRKHTSSPQKPAADNNASPSFPAPANQSKEKEVRSRDQDEDVTDSTPAYDSQNLETCKAFVDAKKKLRLVLSNADFHSMPNLSSYATGGFLRAAGSNDRKENDLVSFLKVQLAEAINLQDKDLIAQLHETIRCLCLFDNQE